MIVWEIFVFIGSKLKKKILEIFYDEKE